MTTSFWDRIKYHSRYNFVAKKLFGIGHFLFELKSTNEDDRRREFILNFILIFMISFLFILELFVLVNYFRSPVNYNGVSVPMFTGLLLFYILLFYFSRTGKLALASHGLIFTYLIFSFYGAVIWGIDLPMIVISYALIIFISSILQGSKFGLAMSLVVFAGVLIIGLSHTHHIFEPVLDWKIVPVRDRDVIEILIALSIISALAWLSNREIEKSLKRARKSEADLKTERDNLEIKIEQRTKELKQTELAKVGQVYRMAEFGKLATGLFHDLVNPLTALSLYVESLKVSDAEHLRGAKDELSKVFSATDRMQEFFIAVRKQFQNSTVEKDFLINSEVEQVIEIFAHRARKLNIKITSSFSGNLSIFGNPFKFHRVLSNLVSNAIDAYLEGSEGFFRKEVHIRGYQKENQIIIEVWDWGKGIPVEILKNIFEPFFTTKFEHGTGIGLALTKEIVEKDFAGSISVSSVVGQGSIFKVILLKSNNKEGDIENLAETRENHKSDRGGAELP